jgi:hypothetical protein
MATSLAEIRAKLQAQETKKSGNKESQTSDNTIFPHWNIPENSTARVRFLPDADHKNSFFWLERLTIKLPFSGIKGQADSKPVIVQVPCVEMYGDACPILAEVRNWYKDESLKETANKYWKKRSYLFQGFVRDNPMGDEKSPENPIRRFVISPQIFKTIKDSLMDPELESIPTDYSSGLDFNIKKSKKGEYADYSTSSWARKESALTQEEATAIEQFGLFNLSDFLPKRPNDEELRIIKEMFEASVDGEAYDPERWSNYYKPYGLTSRDDDNAGPTNASAKVAAVAHQPAPVTEEDSEPPFEVTTPVATVTAQPATKPAAQKAEDILAMIRNRKTQ